MRLSTAPCRHRCMQRAAVDLRVPWDRSVHPLQGCGQSGCKCLRLAACARTETSLGCLSPKRPQSIPKMSGIALQSNIGCHSRRQVRAAATCLRQWEAVDGDLTESSLPKTRPCHLTQLCPVTQAVAIPCSPSLSPSTCNISADTLLSQSSARRQSPDPHHAAL